MQVSLFGRVEASLLNEERDLEEGLSCLRFPAEHRKRIRTTNLLERLLGEGRRRPKVIPHFLVRAQLSDAGLRDAAYGREELAWRAHHAGHPAKAGRPAGGINYQPAIEQAVA